MGVQGNPSGPGLGIDGFATLAALGIRPDTLAASSPSGGVHYWFKPIPGSRSRTLGPGVEWFSRGKFVVAPPAPGRRWLNDLPIAEAPEELKRLVLAPRTQGQGNSSGPLLAEAATEPTSVHVPKPIYSLILRLMPDAKHRDHRRAARLFNMVVAKRSGRNNALNYAAWVFRELVEKGAIDAAGVCELLEAACKANGYLAKDGEDAVRRTIMSGLGGKQR